MVVCLAGSFSGTAGARTARDSTAKTQSSQDSTTRAQSSGAKPTDKTVAVAEIPRGMKLMLKDGTYQVVREYKRDGERVRYYSLERGDWEEIPASMIDWDATEKTKTDDEKTTAALVDKVHKQEEAKRIDNVADVDASLQVGKGAFLPTGEGMFVVEGKTIRLVEQVDSQIKTDKTRAIEQVLSPVPIVPGKKNVVIAGSHAKLRLRTRSPEFYLREAPEDPEHVTRIERSSRPGESGPEVVLLRAKVTRNGRQFQTIRSLFGEELSRDSSEVARKLLSSLFILSHLPHAASSRFSPSETHNLYCTSPAIWKYPNVIPHLKDFLTSFDDRMQSDVVFAGPTWNP